MKDDPVKYLLEEIREEFAAGRVGLYMFPASLGTKFQNMSWAERVKHIAVVLKLLLDSGEARLVWEVWTDYDASRDACGVSPGEDDWEWPSQQPSDIETPYLAIRPNDPATRSADARP